MWIRPVRAASRRTAPAGRCDRGFTMVELMVTLVVLAVLFAIASPSLATFISNSRMRATQGEMLGALTLARSEATKRGALVVVQAVAPASGVEFSGGWRVFVDLNGNGVLDEAAPDNEPVIRTYPALAGKQSLGTGTTGISSAAFNARGFLSTATEVPFFLCGQAGNKKGYQILLEPIGLADVLEYTCT